MSVPETANPHRDPSPEVTITFKGRGTIPFRYEQEYLLYIWCVVEREKKKEQEAAARERDSDGAGPSRAAENVTTNDCDAEVASELPGSPIDRVPSSLASLEEDLPGPAPKSSVCDDTTVEASTVTIATAGMLRQGPPALNKPSSKMPAQDRKKRTQKPRRSMRHVIHPDNLGPRRSTRLNPAKDKPRIHYNL